jgi:hypothetical protein
MPYIDPVEQKEYRLKWIRKRRNEWLSANGPCRRCGSWERLEVDHIDPKTKVSHRIWSWKESTRTEELKKCQVLCRKCHEKKTAEEFRRDAVHGTHASYRRGCRCELCREHQRQRLKAQRERNPKRIPGMYSAGVAQSG